jgi:hypothetical protein
MRKIIFSLLLLNITFSACNNIPDDKFQWEVGISAPKYYPVGLVQVDLEYAGNSSITNFDNGWGSSYGAVVTGEKYKKLPKTATIEYVSAFDNLVYQGTITLPYEKISALFKQYCPDKENDLAEILVGMAPGGWITIWFQSVNVLSEHHIIEVTKAQLKVKQDLTLNPDFVKITDSYWDKYKTYWNHFGAPLEVWAENEAEFDISFILDKPNTGFTVSNAFYSSFDGTVYYFITNDIKTKNLKLPADFVLAWNKNKDSTSYDTHVLMPKNFAKFIKSKKTKEVTIILEIEKDSQYGILSVSTNNKKVKILRFKNEKRTKKGLGESNICKNVEYFI